MIRTWNKGGGQYDESNRRWKLHPSEHEQQDARRIADMELVHRVNPATRRRFAIMEDTSQSPLDHLRHPAQPRSAEDIARRLTKVYFAIKGFDGRCLR